MKRFVLVFSALICGISVYSQTLVKQDVISSAGGFNTGTGISISWTLGETIIPNFKATDNSLYLVHGLQYQLSITAIEENLETLVKITIYPNPASDIINIEFEKAMDDEVNLMIINSQGKPVKSTIIEAATIETQLNLQDLPAGMYYLRLTKGNLSNVYKVVKL